MLIFEQSGDKLELLKYAIDNQYAVSFWYVGKDFKEKKERGEKPKQNWRQVEPFALGKTKKGEWILRGYQYGGVTNSKNKVYKTFSVDEIKDGSLRFMYDKSGVKLQTFKPESYIDDRGVAANFRSDGSDKSMKGGVDKYYDVKKTNINVDPANDISKPPAPPDEEPEIPATDTQPNVAAPMPTPTKVRPGIKAQKPNVSTSEPQAPKPGIKAKKPGLPKAPAQAEPEIEPVEPEDKITPQELDPVEKEDEWEPEPVTENKGFFKWILKLNHGTE